MYWGGQRRALKHSVVSLKVCLNSLSAFIANYHYSKIDNSEGIITYCVSFAVADLTKVEKEWRKIESCHCFVDRDPGILPQMCQSRKKGGPFAL